MADDFLADVFADAAPAVEAAPAPEPEAAVEPTPEAVAEPQPAPEPSPQPEPEQRGGGYVPIDAMLTERDKRQAVERRLADLEAQRQPATIPDSFDDPVGYEKYLATQRAADLQALKVDMSWEFAVDKHGEDKVWAARQWALDKANADEGFKAMVDAQFTAQRMPINWLVQQHQREEAMGKLGGKSLDDWFNEELARRNLTPSAPATVATIPVAATPAPKPAMPPRSIASDASPTRAASSDNPMASLDAIFTR